MKKIFLLFFVSLASNAQLIVGSNQTPTELVQNVLLGNNVYISNVKFNGSSLNATMVRDQVSAFQNGSTTNIGINQGLLLTTGKSILAIGPNTSSGATNATNTPVEGDQDLQILTTNLVKNKASLEFDFVAQGDNISFNFVFASEEYPEWANSSFNDVFGFFLSGPGINGNFTNNSTNIALIPTSNIPIAINNLNNGTANVGPCEFCQYYVSNPYGSPIQFDGFTTVLTAASNVQCGETYHIKLAIANVGDNALDSGVFLQAGSFTSNNCSKAELIAFLDTNNNGIKDGAEINFPYGTFTYQQNNAGSINNITSPTGTYSIYDSTNNLYDINYVINPEYSSYYSAGTTNYNDVLIPTGGTSQTLYFPITLTNTYEDIAINIIPLTQPRLGMNYVNKIEYKNQGSSIANGTITYSNANTTTISSVSESGAILNGTGFTYAFTNLAPFETRSILVTMDVPNIPVLNLDDLLTNNATITSPLSDINLGNNTSNNTQIVIGSYDPNDKMESHGEKILYSSFSSNDYLTYTIRFENTGTASAINAKIVDVLDSKIDETSIRMVSSSHNYTLNRIGSNLTWSFKNIQLPVSVTNSEIGKGYVTFKVKLKPGFVAGDVIPNSSSIFFDYNPAIVTNTYNTQFVSTLVNETFTSNDLFVIHPNPSNSYIQVTSNREIIKNVTVFDILEKIVSQTNGVNNKQLKMDVSSMSSGTYIVEVVNKDGLKQRKKLVIK